MVSSLLTDEAKAEDQEATQPKNESGKGKWAKRILAGGFLFFLLKGLAWLALGALIAMGVVGRK